MLYTTAYNFRRDLSREVHVATSGIKELPEVTGWRSASDPAFVAACDAYNKRKYDEAVRAALASLED